jgi:uncharacterized protein YbjT (DUF2867 family)
MPETVDAASPVPVVFVAGATGYTGRALVAHARQRGLPTLAHVRPGSRRAAAVVPAFEAAGATVLELPWEPEPLVAALAEHRVSHVFSLLGITASGAKKEAARTGGARPTYDAVDKGLTLLLHGACAAQATPPRFVYLSSLGADRPGGSAYLKARHDVESALRAGRVPWLSVRPAIITGADRDEDRTMERLGAVVADGALGLLGRLGATTLRDRYATTTGGELARLMLRAGLAEDGPGRVVDLAELRAR